MANNLIQIKRSATNAIIPTLANGEFAFTSNGGLLYIGSANGSGNIRIAGVQTPGTLTANQALVANTIGYINEVRTANLVVNQIVANNTLKGSLGQVLASGGSGNVYWVDPGAIAVTPAGSNSSVQYNDGGALAASDALQFNNTSNTLTVQNTVSTGALTITGALKANNTVGSAGQILSSNGSVAYWSSPPAGVTGSNTWIQFNDSGSLGSNSTFTFKNDISTLSIGNSTVNTTINSTSFSGTAGDSGTVGGNTASTLRTYSDDKAANAYANAMADTLAQSRTYTGNSTFNGTNSVFGSNVAFGAYIASNFVPVSNNDFSLGSDTKRWKSLYVSGNTIYLGNSTLSVDGSNSVVIGGVGGGLVSNTISVNTISGTGGSVTISSNLDVTSTNVNMTSANVYIKDLSVSGNLTVSGTLTTIDTVNLQVKDPLIKLADNNTDSDALDIGWFGISGNASATYYSGMVRKFDGSGASLDNPVFVAFTTNTLPTTTVDASDAGYKQGSVQAYLQPYGSTGGFIANSTVVNITANSTLSSALVANSLTLSTALGAGYGGTGQNTYSVGDLLVGNSSSGLSILSLNSTAGFILQSNGSALVYDSLDGGSF